jgi:putative peptidoglycan lipid II flippase
MHFNFKNIFKFGFFTLISRILGLLRDSLLAYYLGASKYSDALFVAFKIPNIFRSLFAEGTLQSVFVPLFSNTLKNDKNSIGLFSSQIFTILFFTVLAFISVAEIYMEHIIGFISPGFKSSSKDVFNIAVFLSRISIPYLLFIALATYYSSILNSLNKFSLTALLPVIYNLSMIIGLYFFNIQADYSKSVIAASSNTIGGFIQLVFVYIACRNLGYNFSFTFNFNLHKSSKLFFKRVIPVIFGSGVYQVSILFNTIIASLFPVGTITYLFYAERLTQLPIGVIGVALATVILPSLSNFKGSDTAYSSLKNKGILYAIGLSLPSTIGLILLAENIVKVLFLRGSFHLADVINTKNTLIIYVISLPVAIVIKVLLPIFYSKGNTKIPFLFTLISLFFNLILVYVLSKKIGYFSIPLATTISTYLNFILLLSYLLIKKLLQLDLYFFKEFIKTIFINIILVIVLYECLSFPLISNIASSTTILFIIIFIFILFWLILLKITSSMIYKEIYTSFSKKVSKK